MKDEVQQLLTQLSTLLPMPDDELTSPELLKRYYDIVQQLAQHKDLDPSCIEPLLASFGYFDGYGVYWGTLHLLERFREKLDPYLLAALRHENKGTRIWATMMLMRRRNKAAIPDLIALLDDEVDYVRSTAVDALGTIGGAAMRPYIEGLRDDPSSGVRSSVQHVLADWMEEEIDAPYFILSALTTESSGTRLWGARMLKRSRNKTAIPGLIAFLDDEADFARAHAAEVLSVIGGMAMRPHIEKLRDDPSAEVRGVVKEILDTWDEEATDSADEVDNLLTQLSTLLPMPDDELASAELLDRYAEIVDQLALYNEPRCIETLLESFGYGDGSGVYWRTLHLLESFDPDKVFPYLLAALRLENKGTRLWAARMLKRSGNAEAILNLIGILDDEAEHVRMEAVSALSVLGGSVMRLSIETLRDDPSGEVRAVVKRILDGWAGEAMESE